MQTQTQPPTKTTIYYLSTTIIFSLIFILYLSTSSSPPSFSSDPFLFPPHPTNSSTPSIAYLISGSNGDSGRIIRLLLSVYHPKNHYLLHLDLTASNAERESLALEVEKVAIFKAAKNVYVIGKADFNDPNGCSSVSATLHGASMLLRLSENWDWFINLNAADYPLVTQDDLLHILSYLPKDLNFVNHTSYIGWRESRRLKPIVVDPGLYLSQKHAISYASQKRELPSAYRLFTGSGSVILSRKLIEFCIFGTENLARTLLMYISNTPLPKSVYFQTLICNSRQFSRTVINHNLQYSAFSATRETRHLNSTDFLHLVNSGAAFSSPFPQDDPVLDLIDEKILGRMPGKPTPGGWCVGGIENDTCVEWGHAEVLRPGPGARRLEKLFLDILSNGTFKSDQCVLM
ncbi:beta-glucuronosyltransferase GlcAT14A [Heracleum sosnowskyi]|uniref:Beta-glucuronosyltransferase GlcAT14A n=1 Tax=Heracleum sosnowskyi TaxID=360622 RepID=A0AAD8MP70_9APIA|nr:beta-glucuronosyltransferase GlcAT14A [Heracleum sosnowskyi]